MEYKPYLTDVESKGLLLSTKHALYVLSNGKFVVHNIQVKKTRKVALCDDDNNILHIISRKAYQKYITPELSFDSRSD
jgi:hypothetical protein